MNPQALPFEASKSYRSPQMKLRRVVYRLPTIGKTTLQDHKKALLEHSRRAIKSFQAVWVNMMEQERARVGFRPTQCSIQLYKELTTAIHHKICLLSTYAFHTVHLIVF